MAGKLKERPRTRARPEDRFAAEGFYGSSEGRAHRESNALRRIQRELTARALLLGGMAPPGKILDAGCGSGFSLELLAQLGFDAQGFDADREMVSAAKAKGLRAKTGDLRKMPYADSSFDYAISISALQWLGAGKDQREAMAEYAKCAKEFSRVLRKGGTISIQLYPQNDSETYGIGKILVEEGFKTKIVIENANNPKKKKTYIIAGK